MKRVWVPNGKRIAWVLGFSVLSAVLIEAFQLAIQWIGVLLRLAQGKDGPLGSLESAAALGLGLAVGLIVSLGLNSRLRIRNESVALLSSSLGHGFHPRFCQAIGITFVSCCLSFLLGLALGGEAPSVFMAALLAGGLAQRAFPEREKTEEAIRIGAGVGFGLAFMNPLAGWLAMAEPFRKKDKRIWWEGGLTMMAAYAVLGLLKWGIDGRFQLAALGAAYRYGGMISDIGTLSAASLDWPLAWLVFPLAILMLALAYGFVGLMGGFKSVLGQETPKSYGASTLVGWLVLFPVWLFAPQALGTGSSLIGSAVRQTPLLSLAFGNLSMGILLPFWAVALIRLGLTGISFGGHYPGGAVVPTLTIGSLLAGALVQGLSALWPAVEPETRSVLTVVGMVAFFMGTSKKPLMAAALVLSFLPTWTGIGFVLLALPLGLGYGAIKAIPSLGSRFSEIEGKSRLGIKALEGFFHGTRGLHELFY